MSTSEDRLQSVLSHVATKCGMKDWRYEKNDTSATIDTYFSVLIPFTVMDDSGDEDICQHVYVKFPTTDETARRVGNQLWNVEVYVYNTLVPAFKRIWNGNIDQLFPPCYYADSTPNNQALVLKNMASDGFQCYKERFLDFEHVILSLRSLAQFHALTLVIKRDMEDTNVSLLRPYTETHPIELSEAMLHSFRTHSWLFKGSKYENYWNGSLANYSRIANDGTSKAKCLLYGHGDYSKDNIMYKYEVNSPIKSCMVDFQTCRLMTPACDVLYFILTSTDRRLRRAHYHNFVTEYYTTFKNTLLDLGVELELLYKKEDFISDFKIVASWCFIRMCLAFSLWLGFEYDALIKSKNSLKNAQQRGEELSCFKQILIDGMEDLNEYGYISL